MSRQNLRRLLFRNCLQYVDGKGLVVLCAWCLEPIEDGLDVHEYLVKRSAVNRTDHPLIMVSENMAPLHHECHMAHGQEHAMATRCLHQMGHVVGLDRIGQWYVGLWEKHGLSVPRGILVPPRSVSTAQARNYYVRGREYQGLPTGDIDEAQVGFGIQLWKNRRPDLPQNGHQTLRDQIVRAVNSGYWLDYLGGIIGMSAADNYPLVFPRAGESSVE